MLVPVIEIEGWWSSLKFNEETLITLYADHGTSEQFDLDIKRLPSGKFATNALVLACAQLAYNLLRWIRQNGLLGPGAPRRHRAKRQRIRTMMQELMYLAAPMIYTARRIKLAFGCPVVPIFRRIYAELACTRPHSPSRAHRSRGNALRPYCQASTQAHPARHRRLHFLIQPPILRR